MFYTSRYCVSTWGSRNVPEHHCVYCTHYTGFWFGNIQQLFVLEETNVHCTWFLQKFCRDMNVCVILHAVDWVGLDQSDPHEQEAMKRHLLQSWALLVHIIPSLFVLGLYPTFEIFITSKTVYWKWRTTNLPPVFISPGSIRKDNQLDMVICQHTPCYKITYDKADSQKLSFIFSKSCYLALKVLRIKASQSCQAYWYFLFFPNYQIN